MPIRKRLSDEQERELIALYQDSNAPLDEIKRAYGVRDSLLYSILNRHGILRRTKSQRSTAPLTEERAEVLTKLETPAELTITTDSNGFVQNIERRPASVKLYTWEVRFESAMRVEAATIHDAINEVAKLPMCRRVFNVALKGAL